MTRVKWPPRRAIALVASTVAVLLGSGGRAGASAGLAAERLVLTALGAGFCAAAAAVLWRLDTSSHDTTPHTATREQP